MRPNRDKLAAMSACVSRPQCEESACGAKARHPCPPSSNRRSALRRQRSHVRIVPGAFSRGRGGEVWVVVELSDVQDAARRLEGVAHRTPVVTSRTLESL